MAQKMIRPLEVTAGMRRILIAALDASTGDPTTGVTPINTDLKICKMGAGATEATAGGTLTATAGGYYNYEFTQAELDTRGEIYVRMTKAGLKAVSYNAEVDIAGLYSFGKLQAASGTSMTLAASESSVSTDYVGLKISINGRERYIVGYDGSTKIAQIDSVFPTLPSTNDVYYILGSTGFQAITASAIATATWAALTASNTTPGSFGSALQAIRSNVATAGAASSITLDAAASNVNDYYTGRSIILTAGTGVSQERQITAYNGTTKVATVDSAWTTQPDNTSNFTILASSGASGGGGGGGLTAGQVANAVWDEARAGHTTAGSFGQGVASVQGVVTGNVNGSVASVAGAVAAVTGNIGGNVLGGVAGSVGGVATPVTCSVLTDKTGMSLSSAGINAILDAPVTEPTGRPSWGANTLRLIIGWLGALSLNKLIQNPTLQTVRNSADNANVSTAVQSDDGTTYTRNAWT